jgi:endoglucanase
MFELLKKYTELPGPLGNEEIVQRQFMEDLKRYTDEVEVTNVGNLVAHFPGEGEKVVIFGHADEVCFYVVDITENGFLGVVPHSSRMGDNVPYPYALIGQKALVLGDVNHVRGVFATKSGHILYTEERSAPLKFSDLNVDIGFSSREEVIENGVHIGSPVIWNPTTEQFNSRVFGKAMDDRIAHAIILTLAEKIQNEELACDLYFASTVQEEIGLKGAQDLSRGGFDISLAIDIGIAGDYPALKPGRSSIELGKGPVIVYKDAAIHYNVQVIKELEQTCTENNIPFQQGVFINYGSDSASMIAGGAKPNLIAPPTRYSHQPHETVDLNDLTNTVELFYNYVVK